MKSKLIVGLVLLIVGIGVLFYANHSQNRINRAKSGVETLTSPFQGNAIGKATGNVLKGEASQYDSEVMMLWIGGAVLAVVGVIVLIRCGCSHKK